MSWANDIMTAIRPGMPSGGQVKLAVMTGARTARVGNLDLQPQDLYIPDRLLQTSCINVTETAPDGGGTCTDQSTYSQPLQAGDLVIVCQLSDTRFAILERVVSGA